MIMVSVSDSKRGWGKYWITVIFHGARPAERYDVTVGDDMQHLAACALEKAANLARNGETYRILGPEKMMKHIQAEFASGRG